MNNANTDYKPGFIIFIFRDIWMLPTTEGSGPTSSLNPCSPKHTMNDAWEWKFQTVLVLRNSGPAEIVILQETRY